VGRDERTLVKIENVTRIDECGRMVNAPSAILKEETLHIFFFSGEYECAPGGSLWQGVRPWSDAEIAVEEPHGHHDWQLTEVVHDEGLFQGNSVPLLDGSDFWLFFVTGCGNNWEESRVRALVSRDSRPSWTEETLLDLPSGWLVGTAATRTSWGETLLPIYHERRGIGKVVIFETGRVSQGPLALSSSILADEWIIQPALAECGGRVVAFLRSRNGWLLRSFSDDRGRTWSRATSSGIPNPNSRVALGRDESGALLMAYNPLQHGVLRFGRDQMCSGREILRLARSSDGGVTWPRDGRRDIVWGTGEYGYPWFVEGVDSCVGVAFQECRLIIRILWFGSGGGVVGWDGGSQTRDEQREWLAADTSRNPSSVDGSQVEMHSEKGGRVPHPFSRVSLGSPQLLDRCECGT